MINSAGVALNVRKPICTPHHSLTLREKEDCKSQQGLKHHVEMETLQTKIVIVTIRSVINKPLLCPLFDLTGRLCDAK